MSRTRTLHRVTAVFPRWHPPGGTYTRTWHYQTKRAAVAREERCRTGWTMDYTPEDGITYPAAVSVLREESDPVTWPAR